MSSGEKVMIGILIDSETKKEFQRILIEKYGHVSGKISPVVRELIQDYIEEEKNQLEGFGNGRG